MRKWARFFYQPCLPLGKDGCRATGSKEHIALSRAAAADGMVLLKNEGQVLPFSDGKKVAVFGTGCVDYVKGGGGSGDVTVAYVRSLLEGLRIKEREGKITLLPELGAFYEKAVEEQYAQGIMPGLTEEPEIPTELLQKAVTFTDTALICICRFSGEGWDRTIGEDAQQENIPGLDDGALARSASIFEHGDFYLSAAEQRMVEQVSGQFEHTVVVLNVGGMVDTVWFQDEPKIEGALLAWQGGIEGGLAAADILVGDVNPSGRLVDTFAKRLEDYPSSANFHESDDYVEYTEDIYVGYRYFETVPGAADKVNYPFGFGLSYTEFETEFKKAALGETITIDVVVTNVGKKAGKEVVQLYVSAPQGKLGKPARELKAFAKTRLLAPGESQTLRLTVKESALASYDDSGKIEKGAWVLEKGSYRFYLGKNVREAAELSCQYELEQDKVIEKTGSKCQPILLKKRLCPDGTFEELETHPELQPDLSHDRDGFLLFEPETVEIPRRSLFDKPFQNVITLEDVSEKKASLDAFMAQLTDEQLARLLGGQPKTGVSDTFGMGNLPQYGVPNVMTEDGPAGVRIRPECGVNTTAFPCATLLACTWDEELVQQVGAAGALEAKENNLGIWLTPAMNIHRSPLCGRNFEYYSEDPLIAGKMGAAAVRGIQSQKVAASAKHFACNNKETNRHNSDSRLSERALREIYLKGFEIMVKESDPWTIMTSYNIINGKRSSANKELLTGILRDEWGFQGMLTTDWWNFAEQPDEIKAGNDVKMGNGYPELVLAAMEKGELTREDVEKCARRVLEMILKLA